MVAAVSVACGNQVGRAAPAGSGTIGPSAASVTIGVTGSTTANSAGGCASVIAVAIQPAGRPAGICLPVNGILRLAADPSPRQPWDQLASSDSAVLACVSQSSSNGSVTGACTALHPGTATVSTMTAPFAGDPHGPPQYLWHIAVTVTAGK